MNIFIGIILGIVWILGMILMRSITTLFHELGHALPALAFTRKEKVVVLVGSYHDVSNCWKLQLGRLIIYLKLNVFNWRIGLCQHGAATGLIPQLLIILGGPLASLMIASSAFYLIFNSNLSQGWIVFSTLFLISAVIDFLVNLDPSHKPIKLYDNSIMYTDGYQILRTIKRTGMPEEFFTAEKLMHAGKPAEALAICKELVENPPQKKEVYDLIVESLMKQKNYGDALEFYDILKGIHKLNYLDFYRMGFLNLKMNRYDTALEYFDHCIYEKHTDALTLNHRGYIHLQRGNYERAEMDLEAAIFYAPDFPDAYSNRGLLKIKNRDSASGYQDLQQALIMDATNPSVYYHLGIYFELERDFPPALTNFQKAKELGFEHHGLEMRIAEVERCLELIR